MQMAGQLLYADWGNTPRHNNNQSIKIMKTYNNQHEEIILLQGLARKLGIQSTSVRLSDDGIGITVDYNGDIENFATAAEAEADIRSVAS